MSSKIKVDTIENVAGSGNVSLGSGHNLVVPGNITGQGTAAITSNATVGGTLGVTGDLTVDTSTLKVDSSNNRVGMGTASPSRQVMISRSIADGSGELGIVSSDSSTSGALGNIHFGNSTDTSLASIRATADGATDAGKLEFNTEKTGAAIETAMRIDSNGYVTKLKQPMFHMSGQGAHSVATTGYFTYTSSNIFGQSPTEYDPDGLFNVANGRFTAPVAGRYFFIFSIGISFTSGYHYTYIRKNGSDVSGLSRNVDQENDYSPQSIQGILNLAANDYVTAERNNNNVSGAVVGAQFSGFLIG